MYQGQQWQVNHLSVILLDVNYSVPKLSCKDLVIWVPRQTQLWTEFIWSVSDHVWLPHQKGWASSRSDTAHDQHQTWTPQLPVRQQFSPVLCWDEQVSEEKEMLPWMHSQLWTTESLQTGSRQWGRTETNIQIATVVSLHRAERNDVLAPSLIFSFRNTSLLWYSAYMYVQIPTQTRHMQRHQSTDT